MQIFQSTNQFNVKTVRLFASVLFLTTGIYHVYAFIKDVHGPNSLPAILFGLIFLTTAGLLIMRKKAGIYVGAIFTLIPVVMGLSLGIKNWNDEAMFCMMVEFLALICCTGLIIKRKQFI
jgi:hypothetical protein